MSKTFIIAEAGVNHNGDIDIAKKMIEVAADSGADCIKFQTFSSEKLVSKYAETAEYQKLNLNDSKQSQLAMIKKLELPYESFYELQSFCKQCNIIFLSTPFDIESISFLEKMQMPFWKIPSGEITNFPYLLKIAQTRKPIVMSTGMSTISEIKESLEVLKNHGSSDITLLHCNTEYPTPFEDVNLNAMLSLKKEFDVAVGYSDHTIGIELPVAAVALGAKIIEKHFTLNQSMEGPDHKASLNPTQLKDMVNAIRNIEMAMGSNQKFCSKSELKNLEIARKSIVAAYNIQKGEIFTEHNITTKRPGKGISPMQWQNVLGKIAKRDFLEDELIEL